MSWKKFSEEAREEHDNLYSLLLILTWGALRGGGLWYAHIMHRKSNCPLAREW